MLLIEVRNCLLEKKIEIYLVFYFERKKKFIPLHSQSFGAFQIQAGMVELVDIPDLGSGAARHGGSSPSTRTNRALLTIRF